MNVSVVVVVAVACFEWRMGHIAMFNSAMGCFPFVDYILRCSTSSR